MEKNTIGGKIVKLVDNAYVTSIISRCISIVLVFVYTALRSRFFQPALQGESAVITEYVDFLVLVIALGIHEAYPFYKKQEKAVFNDFLGAVFSMFFVYASMAAILVGFGDLGHRVNTIVLSIPIAFLVKELNYVLLIESPKKYNAILLLCDVLDIFVVIGLMLFLKAELMVLLVYLIGRRVLYLVVIFFALKIKIRNLKPSVSGVAKYVKYGCIPMITIIMMEINYKADIIMLSWFNVEEALIGIYSLAVSLSQKIWLIPDAMKDILLSRLTQKADSKEVALVSRMSILSVVAISAVFVLVGYPVVNLFFGESYSQAYSIVLWLLIGVFGMIFYKMVYAYNVIHGRKNINLILLTSAAVVNIVLNAVLIPLCGIVGAALSSSISYLTCGLGFLLIFHMKTKVPIRDMIFASKSDFMQLGIRFSRR